MSYFVPTRFCWRFGGRQVHLCGSFTRWVETVPMAPVEGSPGVFAVVVHLPPGYHQYKFIVDGKWRHDETAPFMPDPLGNVNNWLFVRRIEPTPQLATSLPFEQQLLAVQQQAAAAQQAQAQQAAVAAQAAAAAAQQQQLLAHAQLVASAGLQNVPPATSTAPITGTLPAPQQGDVDMANAEAVVAPIVIHNPKEPEYTRKKISDFLHSHTAYELIPESGKVVVLDVDLPVRQAFHALHEQGIASAPLWDSPTSRVIGVISASDFIHILKRLRNSVSSGANPMSEAEMDAHTIRGLREEAGAEGREPKQLAYVRPEEDLSRVVGALFRNKCNMAPILSGEPGTGAEVASVLSLATLSGVLACLMRHFRASLASLPLLAQPLGSLPLGTWSPDAAVAHTDVLPDSKDRRQWRKLQPLHTVTPTTPLTTALSLLLEAGVSALPVVDDKRCLLDIYARSDITQLCKGNAYNRLQWEDVTVGQALALANGAPLPWHTGPGGVQQQQPPQDGPPPQHPSMGGLSAEFQAQAALQQHQQQAAGAADPIAASLLHAKQQAAAAGVGVAGSAAATLQAAAQLQHLQLQQQQQQQPRVYVCSKDDTLRTVVERLAVPGVRRLIIVQPETRRVEGLISLSDVASYLFL